MVGKGSFKLHGSPFKMWGYVGPNTSAFLKMKRRLWLNTVPLARGLKEGSGTWPMAQGPPLKNGKFLSSPSSLWRNKLCKGPEIAHIK